MAIGPKGKAFVTGSSSGTFPTTPGAYLASSGNYNTSGFAAEFDTSLSGSASLVWSTVLTGDAGSQSQSTGTAIAVDSKGDAYVASSASPDFRSRAALCLLRHRHKRGLCYRAGSHGVRAESIPPFWGREVQPTLR